MRAAMQMSAGRYGEMPLLPSAAQGPFAWDSLRVAPFIVHCLIVTYGAIGWLSPTRITLLLYLLVLPMFVMQWLLNAGSSILDNAETLIRTGRWHDARNRFEGHFFEISLGAAGIRAGTVLINLVVCMTLLIFDTQPFTGWS